MKKKKIYLFLTVSICFYICFVSCSTDYSYNFINLQTRSLSTDLGGINGSPVWLTENTIALLHNPSDEDYSPWVTRIVIVDLDSENWLELPLPMLPEACSTTAPVSVGNLTRMPDGSLGYVLSCDLKTRGVKTAIFKWNADTNFMEMLYEYEPYFQATWFSFSPEMIEFIQASGSGTDDQIYRIGENRTMEQLVPSFLRANYPSYSSDGKTVAFIGNEAYPGKNPDEFTKWEEIRELLFYPWDIYLINVNQNEVRSVFSGIVDPKELEWVPNNNELLSFSGYYNDEPGIWLLDLDTGDLTRIWSERTSYSWSPDGGQIIIESNGEKSGGDTSLTFADVNLNRK